MDTLLTAADVFVGTNFDDLLVLTVLFLAARARTDRIGCAWAVQST